MEVGRRYGRKDREKMSGNDMGKRVRKEDNLLRKVGKNRKKREGRKKRRKERKDRRRKAIIREERGRKRRWNNMKEGIIMKGK